MGETGHETERVHGTNVFHGMHDLWSDGSGADCAGPAGDCPGQDKRLIVRKVNIHNR